LRAAERSPAGDRRPISWGLTRLRLRYERDSERFYALVLLACSVICFNTLRQPPW